MKHTAIYPGTFDPVTNGHLDIIRRASTIFPKLVVAVAANEVKRPLFSLSERIAMIESALDDLPAVSVCGFDCLLIDFVREQDASVILRGLRAVNDFEYEFQLAGMNKKLSPGVETVFLTPSESVLCISSSLVREIVSYKGDISQFVPKGVVATLKARF